MIQFFFLYSEKSEKQLKREAKKAEKMAKKAVHKGQSAEVNKDEGGVDDGPDCSEGKYGNAPMNQSRDRGQGKSYVDIPILNHKLNGKKVWVRARLHTSRAKGEIRGQ